MRVCNGGSRRHWKGDSPAVQLYAHMCVVHASKPTNTKGYAIHLQMSKITIDFKRIKITLHAPSGCFTQRLSSLTKDATELGRGHTLLHTWVICLSDPSRGHNDLPQQNKLRTHTLYLEYA